MSTVVHHGPHAGDTPSTRTAFLSVGGQPHHKSKASIILCLFLLIKLLCPTCDKCPLSLHLCKWWALQPSCRELRSSRSPRGEPASQRGSLAEREAEAQRCSEQQPLGPLPVGGALAAHVHGHILYQCFMATHQIYVAGGTRFKARALGLHQLLLK